MCRLSVGFFMENLGCAIKSSAQSRTDSLKGMKSQLSQRREGAMVPAKEVR